MLLVTLQPSVLGRQRLRRAVRVASRLAITITASQVARLRDETGALDRSSRMRCATRFYELAFGDMHVDIDTS